METGAIEDPLSDEVIYEQIAPLLVDCPVDQHQQIVATKVLSIYAKGELPSDKASEIAADLLKRSSYQASVYTAWRKRKFKELGNKRKPSLSLCSRLHVK
jgi:hypothetical protein